MQPRRRERRQRQNSREEFDYDERQHNANVPRNTANALSQTKQQLQQQQTPRQNGRSLPSHNQQQQQTNATVRRRDTTSGLEELVLQLTPTAEECSRRFQAFAEVRELLSRALNLHLYVFGSQRTGIALPSSDVDVVARSEPLASHRVSSSSSTSVSASSSSSFSVHTNSTASSDRDESDEKNGNSKHRRRKYSSSSSSDDDSDNSESDDDDEDPFAPMGNLILNSGNSNNSAKQNGYHHHHHGQRRGATTVNGRTSGEINTPRNKRQAPRDFYAVANLLRRDNRFCDVRVIAHARVPIIKVRHRRTRVEIDICFADDGLCSSQYLTNQFDVCARQHQQPARALVVLLKAFVAALGVNDPAVGGVGSFVCSMLVLWFLTNERKRAATSSASASAAAADRENGDKDNVQFQSSCSLAELWHRMLRFYVDEFDVEKFGVDCASMVAFSKPRTSELVMMNPLERSRNCASAAKDFVPVVLPAMELFARRYEEEYERDHGQHWQQNQKQSQQRHQHSSSSNLRNDISSSSSIVDWILDPENHLLNWHSMFVHQRSSSSNRQQQQQQQFSRNGSQRSGNGGGGGGAAASFFDDDEDDYSALDLDFDGGRYRQQRQKQQQQQQQQQQKQQRTYIAPKSGSSTSSSSSMMMNRWENTAKLKNAVSRVPQIDADGFFSSLSF